MNMCIDHIHKLYKQGETTPKKLLLKLREKAVELKPYNAWITLLTESQLLDYCDGLEGKEIDTLPLFGIPFAIKDNIDLAGIDTTAGCESFRYQAGSSAFVVECLINAGAIPLGKTNLDQFATGLVGTRSPYGEGKNTFNSDYISGGSSAGSAIATALGLVSFALGTDTAGSGRVPAVLNNLIGHKPTKGLLSCSGVVPACKSLDCVSIFALIPRDAAKVLSVAAHYDEQDAYARENQFNNSLRFYSSPSKFTFAVPRDCDFLGDQETQKLFNESIENLERMGGVKTEVDFTPFIQAAKLLYEGPWVAERWLATRGVDTDTMLPEIKTIIGNGNSAQAADVFAAQYKLAALKKLADQIVSQYDFVLAPTTPTFFTRTEIADEPIKNNSILGTYTNFMNLLDYSATAIPVGLTKSDVPWGPTIFSHAWRDMQLLHFAERIQSQNNLPLGATQINREQLSGTVVDGRIKKEIQLLVCGAHLDGQPLNWQLTERGAKKVSETLTSPCYRLFVLPDNKRPALVRDDSGASIKVEVWSMPESYVGGFVDAIPAPLGIGKVELQSGEWVSGFICDSSALLRCDELQEITALGGWAAWVKAQQPTP